MTWRPLALVLPALPVLAHAEASISGEAMAGAEYSSNVHAVPEGTDETADEIFSVRPSLRARLETRGLSVSAGYRLDYYHYRKETALDRALHRLDARAALIWWDDVDLELTARLDPRPVSSVEPIDDPANLVQEAAAGGRAAYRRELGPSTRLSLGYRGEQVLWIEVHDGDADRLPPDYLAYGPELEVERDVGRTVVIGLEYRYRRVDFDEAAGNAPSAGDSAAHGGLVRVGVDASEWLSASLGYGLARVDYARADPAQRHLVDARVTAGRDVARLSASFIQRLTQDLYGNPAEARAARLGADYTPWAPWALGAAATYGALAFDDGAPAAGLQQSFVMGELHLFYRVPMGLVEIAASRHESLPTGGEPKVAVNRASLRLGGRF